MAAVVKVDPLGLCCSGSAFRCWRLASIPILGVILFFAGSELAIVVKDIGDKKADFYVMLIVAAFAMWNLGAAFVMGVALDHSLCKGWLGFDAHLLRRGPCWH